MYNGKINVFTIESHTISLAIFCGLAKPMARKSRNLIKLYSMIFSIITKKFRYNNSYRLNMTFIQPQVQRLAIKFIYLGVWPGCMFIYRSLHFILKDITNAEKLDSKSRFFSNFTVMSAKNCWWISNARIMGNRAKRFEFYRVLGKRKTFIHFQ